MKEYQVKVFTQNGQEIVSKWLDGENEDNIIFLDLLINKTSTANILKIAKEDGSMAIIMSEALKNSVVTIRERTV